MGFNLPCASCNPFKSPQFGVMEFTKIACTERQLPGRGGSPGSCAGADEDDEYAGTLPGEMSFVVFRSVNSAEKYLAFETHLVIFRSVKAA